MAGRQGRVESGWIAVAVTIAMSALGGILATAQRITRVEAVVSQVPTNAQHISEIDARLIRIEEDVHWLRRDRETERRSR